MVFPKTLKTRPAVSLPTEQRLTTSVQYLSTKVKPSVDLHSDSRIIPSPNPMLLQGRFLRFSFRHFCRRQVHCANLRKPRCKQKRLHNGS